MDSTKKEEPTDNGGDMLTAYQSLYQEKKAEDDQRDGQDDGEKGNDGADKAPKEPDEPDEALGLGDPKEGEDIAAWKEQKEKGIKKLVERNKARQTELEAKIKEAEEGRSSARFYLDNKADIDGAMLWLHKASSPETMEEAIAELRLKVTGAPFDSEFESEKKLAAHLDGKYKAQIDALRSELDGIRAPLASERKAKADADALERKAEDTYEEAALEIAATCSGYQLDKEDYRKSLKANPGSDGAEAVRRHLFSEILAHTAKAASGQRPKKREMIDSATKKDAVPPDSSDMMAHLQYMRDSGLIKSG